MNNWTENHRQIELMNKVIFKVQKKIWKEDKVFIKQSTIRDICFECIDNGVYSNNCHSLYLNCIVDGLEALIKLNNN